MLMNYQRGLQQKDPSPYWTPEIARQKAMESFLKANGTALENDYSPQVLPQYNYGQQAAQLGADTALTNFNSSINAANNAVAGSTAGGPTLKAILRALGAQESGNNYGAVNSDSGALGRWQVMPSNIQGSGGWDMEALGRNISTQEFLNNRQLQNAIVRFKFGNYLKAHGLKGALSTWYSGDPNKWNNKSPQGDYPSIHQYVLDVLERLGIK